MIMHAFLILADHLIELMSAGVVVALSVRYLAYRSGQRDQIYFKTFARGVEKVLDTEDKHGKVENVDEWMHSLCTKVMALLPDRSLRFGPVNAPVTPPGEPMEGTFRFQNRESFTDFADGKKSVIHGIRQQMDVFKSAHLPDFYELTQRVLDQDKQWKNVLGIKVETLTRILDIMPGLFVVGGIFGTFIGIASALPAIGKIDLSRIQESAPILTGFIDGIALSMRCSIAGILASVIMTVLNALFPINSSRIDVQRELERAFEMIWHRIHGNNVSFSDGRIIALLEKLCDLTSGASSKSKKVA
jgi:hypothetical protein